MFVGTLFVPGHEGFRVMLEYLQVGIKVPRKLAIFPLIVLLHDCGKICESYLDVHAMYLRIRIFGKVVQAQSPIGLVAHDIGV